MIKGKQGYESKRLKERGNKKKKREKEKEEQGGIIKLISRDLQSG